MKKFSFDLRGGKLIILLDNLNRIYFHNGIGTFKSNIYICDNSRYPKRMGKYLGKFKSLGNSRLINESKSIYKFKQGKYVIYLSEKGNFYIFEDES